MNFKVQDYYFKKAKKENFLARSVYKLEEIDERFKILKPKQMVLDLGYYPGSWAQYASKRVGPSGMVIGVDIKPVNKALLNEKNIKLFEKDVFDINQINELFSGTHFDVLLSDMAPNTSGIKMVDQARSLNLVEKIFAMIPTFLKLKGDLVLKVFDGHDAQEFLKTQKNRFDSFQYLKPKSTRSISKEFFVIGKSFRA